MVVNKKYRKEKERRKGKSMKLNKEEMGWLTENTRWWWWGDDDDSEVEDNADGGDEEVGDGMANWEYQVMMVTVMVMMMIVKLMTMLMVVMKK